MFLTRVSIYNYRNLEGVEVSLSPFTVLVGPNGSGKSAFLEGLLLPYDIDRYGLRRAILSRSDQAENLSFRKGEHIAIRLVWDLKGEEAEYYVDVDPRGQTIVHESLRIRPGWMVERYGRMIHLTNSKTTIELDEDAQDLSLASLMAKLHRHGFEEAGNLSELARRLFRYPVTLLEGRRAWGGGTVGPGRTSVIRRIDALKTHHQDAYRRWLDVLSIELGFPADGISDVLFQSDKKGLVRAYFVVGGKTIPASDGQAWFAILSALAYFPDKWRLHLIDNLESWLSPDLVEGIFRILSESPEAQWIVVSYHPLIVRLIRPENLLLFQRGEGGSATVIRGDQHPVLKNLSEGDDAASLFMARAFE